MAVAADDEALVLAALISSRVCHDIINPVGAIGNGFEILEDEQDAEMRQMALDLVRSNAEKASARLQLARMAFGAMGGAGAEINLDEARERALAYFNGEKVSIDWPATGAVLPRDLVKLSVNLVVIAADCLMRGGAVSVRAVDGGLDIAASGERVGMNDGVRAALAGETALADVDAHKVQAYYAGRLAAGAGYAIGVNVGESAASFTVRPA